MHDFFDWAIFVMLLGCLVLLVVIADGVQRSAYYLRLLGQAATEKIAEARPANRKERRR